MNHWKIIIEDLAQLDFYEAYEWYEKEKTGLVEEFLDSFEETISASRLLTTNTQEP